MTLFEMREIHGCCTRNKFRKHLAWKPSNCRCCWAFSHVDDKPCIRPLTTAAWKIWIFRQGGTVVCFQSFASFEYSAHAAPSRLLSSPPPAGAAEMLHPRYFMDSVGSMRPPSGFRRCMACLTCISWNLSQCSSSPNLDPTFATTSMYSWRSFCCEPINKVSSAYTIAQSRSPRRASWPAGLSSRWASQMSTDISMTNKKGDNGQPCEIPAACLCSTEVCSPSATRKVRTLEMSPRI